MQYQQKSSHHKKKLSQISINDEKIVTNTFVKKHVLLYIMINGMAVNMLIMKTQEAT